MIHARRKRKDGSYYTVKWCNECQRKRVNLYNASHPRIKKPQFINTNQKLMEKYA